VLGRALRRLGARVTYVTDSVNVPLVEAALKTLDEPWTSWCTRAELTAPGGCSDAEKPTHLVAIERPGRKPRRRLP
jgi:hypothetical protein